MRRYHRTKLRRTLQEYKIRVLIREKDWPLNKCMIIEGTLRCQICTDKLYKTENQEANCTALCALIYELSELAITEFAAHPTQKSK